MWVDSLLLSSCQRTLIISRSSKLFSPSSHCSNIFFWHLYRGTSNLRYTSLSSIFLLYFTAFYLEFLTWENVAKSGEAKKNSRWRGYQIYGLSCCDGAYWHQEHSGCCKGYSPAEAFWLRKRMKPPRLICGLSQTVNGLCKSNQRDPPLQTSLI